MHRLTRYTIAKVVPSAGDAPAAFPMSRGHSADELTGQMVTMVGLAPTRPFGHTHLKRARLLLRHMAKLVSQEGVAPSRPFEPRYLKPRCLLFQHWDVYCVCTSLPRGLAGEVAARRSRLSKRFSSRPS